MTSAGGKGVLTRQPQHKGERHGRRVRKGLEPRVMSNQLMIYGATGYTGRLTVQRAMERGLRPLLGGRNKEKLQRLAEAFGCEYRVFSLAEPRQLEEALTDVAVVLNMAGPFVMTATPLADVCLHTGVHYLDITGEIAVFAALALRDGEARAKKVMLMPGVGFAIVPSDCLAAHLVQRLPGAQRLFLGISRAESKSRGSIKTMIDLITDKVTIRSNGHLLSIPMGVLEKEIDYGYGARTSTAVSWGDVFTAFYTTGIPNIEVYAEVNPLERQALWLSSSFAWWLSTAPAQLLLKVQAELLPEGPSMQDLTFAGRSIVAEAEDDWGKRVRSRLYTPDGYTFTAVTALAIVEKIFGGDFAVGFQTPAQVYGADFILAFDNVFRQDLEV